MKRAMNDEEGRPITLRRYLGSRLLPIASLVAATVSLSAPAAFLDVRMRELRAQAEATGRTVASVIAREASVQPSLWQYDTLKLVEHVRAHEQQTGVERIELATTDGLRLGLGAGADLGRLRSADVLWGSAPLVVHGETVGAVWVAVAASDARRTALLLLAPFSALGILLAALIYGIPLRAAGRAELRIGALVSELDRSRAALEGHGEHLEREVRARSSELSRAYDELQRKEARLRELSSRTAALEEDERRAIARELHDTAGQALTAIRIHLQLLGETLPEGDARRTLVAQTTAMTDQTLDEIRRAVRMLGPAILHEVPLAQALERYCDDFAERARVLVLRTLDAGSAPLSPAVEGACYRIVQEALTNVARHAAARSVTILVERRGENLLVAIEDDGAGFVASEPSEGRGLIGMRERTELLGGTFHVSTTPGSGTRVRASLPLEETHA
jgi:two-component system sensor histidine kinase UhpB